MAWFDYGMIWLWRDLIVAWFDYGMNWLWHALMMAWFDDGMIWLWHELIMARIDCGMIWLWHDCSVKAWSWLRRRDCDVIHVAIIQRRDRGDCIASLESCVAIVARSDDGVTASWWASLPRGPLCNKRGVIRWRHDCDRRRDDATATWRRRDCDVMTAMPCNRRDGRS